MVIHIVYVIALSLEMSEERSWFNGFKRQHTMLTIRAPQPLPYCTVRCGEILKSSVDKVGSIYGKLHLVSKPMQILNQVIVHKSGKVCSCTIRSSKHVLYYLSQERENTQF